MALAEARETLSSMGTTRIAPDALLDRARTAAAGGSLREAIDLYTAANASARSAVTERELVQLRHRAAITSQRGPGRDAWPPEVDDPFPDVAGLPEITVDQLDSTTLGGAIQHHGALVVRNFATSRADMLRHAIDDALAAQDDPEHADPDDGWHTLFEGELDQAALVFDRALTMGMGSLLAADSPRALFLFLQLIDDLGFADMVAEYLGERPLLSVNKTTFRRVREAPRPAWHQDGSFMGDVRTVNLWVSLSHCGGDTDAIGLDLIPYRIEELLPTGTHGAEAPIVAIGQQLVEGVSTTGMITPEFRPGDALCFDDRFLHRTSAADVTGERHAIEAWFFAPSHFPEQYGPLAV
jgi:hypothetical protein